MYPICTGERPIYNGRHMTFRVTVRVCDNGMAYCAQSTAPDNAPDPHTLFPGVCSTLFPGVCSTLFPGVRSLQPLLPGEKRKKEAWENIYVFGMVGNLILAFVLLYYQPDTE